MRGWEEPSEADRLLWKEDAEAAYKEAQRRIAKAKVEGRHDLDFSFREWALPALSALPPEISELTKVSVLDLRDTQISDVSALSGLTALKVLSLSGTAVSDVSVLSGLPALEILNLSGTAVSDVSVLSSLTALELLELSGTAVSDVSALSGLPSLQSLNLSGTAVSDLSPLSGLTALKLLELSGTQVSDLSPLSELSTLIDGAEAYVFQGLHYRDTPVAAQPVFSELVKLDNPERTIQTLQYLKGEHPVYGGPPPPVGGIPSVPDEPGHALPAQYDGKTLRLDNIAPPGSDALEHLFDMLRRYADRLNGPGGLGNVPNALSLAVTDYLSVLPEEYDSLNQIKLGLEGRALSQIFQGFKGEIEAETPEKSAQIEAMLTTHEDLAVRMPEWISHLTEVSGKSELSEENDTKISEHLNELADQLSEVPADVEQPVIDTLKYYAGKAGQHIKDAALTGAMAVRDVIFAAMRWARDVSTDAAEQAKGPTAKGLGGLITAAVLGTAFAVLQQVPWLASSMRSAMEFLKSIVSLFS